MSDIYFDRSEFLAAAKAPEYATSGRYRDEVAAKLQRSMAAGTITPMGQHHAAPRSPEDYTRYAHREAEAIYGSHNPMPTADPMWVEAAKVRSGVFDGPEAIARAMGAPQFAADPTYQQAVREKIARSISGGHITPELTAVTPPTEG